MKHGQRVLVVDPSAESREVIRTVLERRGVAVVEADNARTGEQLAQQFCPHLVVVDDESVPNTNTETGAGGGAHLDVPRVVLGKLRRTGEADRSLPKPYQYATLIRTIEELLGSASEAQRPAA